MEEIGFAVQPISSMVTEFDEILRCAGIAGRRALRLALDQGMARADIWRRNPARIERAAWCGGSEVRIILPASPKCGLLNQSHTRSTSC
jgi:hypothetical protein